MSLPTEIITPPVRFHSPISIFFKLILSRVFYLLKVFEEKPLVATIICPFAFSFMLPIFFLGAQYNARRRTVDAASSWSPLCPRLFQILLTWLGKRKKRDTIAVTEKKYSCMFIFWTKNLSRVHLIVKKKSLWKTLKHVRWLIIFNNVLLLKTNVISCNHWYQSSGYQAIFYC